MTDELNDTIVAQYLADHPEFFTQKDKLLLEMSIPHESGEAISLLERQVSLLREQTRERQENINSFVANAKANDELFSKIRALILELLRTTSLEELSRLIAQRLKDEFSASISKLVFVTETDNNPNQSKEITLLPLAATKEALGDLFERKKSFCGPLKLKNMTLFFPDAESSITSAAIIPVHPVEGAAIPGIPLLIIGSDRENRFHSELDTLFLDFIGEVLAVHISTMDYSGKSTAIG